MRWLPGLLMSLLAGAVLADVPLTMSYQGLLTDNNGTVVPDGNYNLSFALYPTETGGTPA